MKIKSALSVGIVATIFVFISNIVNNLTKLGTFAWIGFIIWTYSLAVWSKNEDNKKNALIWTMIGQPLGVLLALAMIKIPELCNGNILVTYAMVFLANGAAMLLPGKMISGVFLGIAFTFSGLGVVFTINSISSLLILIGIIELFTLLGTLCPYVVNLLTRKKI